MKQVSAFSKTNKENTLDSYFNKTNQRISVSLNNNKKFGEEKKFNKIQISSIAKKVL